MANHRKEGWEDTSSLNTGAPAVLTVWPPPIPPPPSADDTVEVDLITGNLEGWFHRNNFLLDVSKTKELVADFGRKQERNNQNLQ